MMLSSTHGAVLERERENGATTVWNRVLIDGYSYRAGALLSLGAHRLNDGETCCECLGIRLIRMA